MRRIAHCVREHNVIVSIFVEINESQARIASLTVDDGHALRQRKWQQLPTLRSVDERGVLMVVA